MALSQEDRISISKKIVSVPIEDKKADALIANIDTAIVKAQKEDTANKGLLDAKSAIINPYQAELTQYDGNGRVVLTEQMMLDSVDRVKNNHFFPNDPQVPIGTDIPDGIWKYFPAYHGTAAIGKNFDGTYTIVPKEQDKIDAINAQITIIEGLVDATRSSGQELASSGNPPTFTLQPSPVMQQAAIDLKAAVDDYNNFLTTTNGLIPTAAQDSDATRLAQNDAARADITTIQNAIALWQSYQDFDTTTSLPTDQNAFNTKPATDFQPSKFRSIELDPFKASITSRINFINNTRITQLNSILGSVTQDLTNGEITNTTGFYGDRFRLIDMRVNAIGGSLTKLKGLQSGKEAQIQSKKSNANAASTYATIMVATSLIAPTQGNKVVHVTSATGFNVGDSVYIVGDSQPEVSAVIQNISGNSITLDIDIPKRYTLANVARLYKVL